MPSAVEQLREVFHKLNARDQDFASSLLSSKRLSDKQLYWVGELTRRANGDIPAATTVDVGNVKGIVDLLDRAAKHLKRPAVIVRANGRDIRLNVAGRKAKVPGSINVCGAAGGFGDRDWYGRVTRDGKFEPSRKYDTNTVTAVAAALQAMASDPAKAAAAYGHMTGVCCFCNTALTDARSLAVGYGPVCAKHYELPWGNKEGAAAILAAVDLAVSGGRRRAA
jgi:hypothetical protein